MSDPILAAELAEIRAEMEELNAMLPGLQLRVEEGKRIAREARHDIAAAHERLSRLNLRIMRLRAAGVRAAALPADPFEGIA